MELILFACNEMGSTQRDDMKKNMRLMFSSQRLPSGGKAREQTVFEGTCSFPFVNRWFIGNQGIVGGSSSNSRLIVVG